MTAAPTFAPTGACDSMITFTDGAEDKPEESDLWLMGVILSIVSSILSNLGVNTQKWSMIREAQRKPEERRAYVCQPFYLLGVLMIFVGSLGDFVALGMAPQSLVTPVGGMTIVANLFFASMWLRERLGCRDIIGTTLVVAGVVGTAFAADKSKKEYTLDCLLDLYQRPNMYIYGGSFFGLFLVLYVVQRKLARMRKQCEEEGELSEAYCRWIKLHSILPPTLSGLVGAQSILFAKCTMELLKKAFFFQEYEHFERVATWAIVFAMFFCVFSQLHWLAVGLHDFDAVLMVPVFQCWLISGAVLGGAVYFEDFKYLPMRNKLIFAGGVGVTIVGVVLLAQRKHTDHGEGKGDEEDTDQPEGVPRLSMLRAETPMAPSVALFDSFRNVWQYTPRSDGSRSPGRLPMYMMGTAASASRSRKVQVKKRLQQIKEEKEQRGETLGFADIVSAHYIGGRKYSWPDAGGGGALQTFAARMAERRRQKERAAREATRKRNRPERYAVDDEGENPQSAAPSTPPQQQRRGGRGRNQAKVHPGGGGMDVNVLDDLLDDVGEQDSVPLSGEEE